MTENPIRQEAWTRHKSGDYSGAEGLYRELLRENPHEIDICNLGALLRAVGRGSEAFILYKKWLDKYNGSASLIQNAVNCALSENHINKARHWIAKGLEKDKGNIELIKLNARILQREGRSDYAIKILEAAAKTEKDINILLELGKLYNQKGEKLRAVETFCKALKINQYEVRAIANIITVYQEAGEYEKAELFIQSLGEDLKNDGLIKGAIAYLMMKQNKIEIAEKLFGELCRETPSVINNWLNRCACLRSIKHPNQALRVIKKGFTLEPNNKLVGLALKQCLAEVGKFQAITKMSRINKSSDDISDDELFNMQFMGEGYRIIESSVLKQAAIEWEKDVAPEDKQNLWADRMEERLTKRRLRVGYMSADFCNHPVGRFLMPIIKNHNRDDYEIIGIDCSKNHDDKHRLFKELCDEWIDINYLEDFRAARKISEKQVDIIVELGGYTANSRLKVLCYKPAKIQLSYLGYFAPTYLKCIDGWIGDKELFAGLNRTQAKAHRLIHIEKGYMSYVDLDTPRPKRVKDEKFRFGSFNHSRKLSEETIELYVDIMNKADNALLVLKSISFVEIEEQERIKAKFIKYGLDESKLILLPWVEGKKRHLECYNEVDVALDPMPYGGATTTCEALYMGVPVISLAGMGMVGRLSSSILKTANLEEWICKTKEEYIIKAILEANKGRRSEKKRKEFIKNLKKSPLSDAKRVAKSLEENYKLIISEKDNSN